MLNVERIQKILKERRITYAKLSEMTGYNTAILHRYCTGYTKSVPADRLSVISKVLETTPEYLLGIDDEQKIENENVQYSRDDYLLSLINSLSLDNKLLVEALIIRLIKSQS